MGKSKKIRGGVVDALNDRAVAAAKTVQHAVEVGDAAVKTAKTGVETIDSAVGVAKEGFIVGQKTAQLAGQVVDSSKLITEKSGLLAATTLEKLTNQIGNVSANIDALSDLSVQSLNKLTPGLSDTAGNVGSIASSLSNSVNETISSGSTIVTSLISILALPFAGARRRMAEMNKEPADATQKYNNFQEIKTLFLADFDKIRINTVSDFKLQIDNILKAIAHFIKLINETCVSGRVYGKICDTETIAITSRLTKKENLLKAQISRTLEDINFILMLFTQQISSMNYNSGDGDEYLNKFYETATEIQSRVITDAMTKLTEKITYLNSQIDIIEAEVELFLEKPKSNGGKKTVKRRYLKRKIRKSYRKKSKR